MVNTVIFDLGGVLIDWNPRYVFNEGYFKEAWQSDYFFNSICTGDWNENQDAGYPIIKATEEKIAEFPDWEQSIRDFYGRWEEMLGGPIAGTVALFRRLKERPGVRTYALTNWSAETFPVALQRFEFLHWFDGRVVSGEEGTRKPFPEFYMRLLNRYELAPGQAFFIDDNLRNVKAAEDLGIRSHHFQSAEGLEEELRGMGLI